MATETETSKNHENLQDCDLVMKGGATSGLVYPEAVLRLKGTHRFRSIGGTSAGALAAAVAAAAEYNRHGPNGGGFKRLEELNRKLQGADGGGGQGQGAARPTYLRNLFQGSKATQPLLNIVQDMADYRDEIRAIDTRSGRLPMVLSGLRLLRRIVTDSKVPGVDAGRSKGFWYGAGLAALLAAIIGFLAGSWVGFGVALVVLGVIFALAGRWLGELGTGLLGLVRIVTTEVPRNYFGICNGRNDPANTEYARDQEAITDWLHRSIQETAGRAVDRDVLTFADLEQPDASRPDGKKPNIKLAFMVTDISEGRPYVLPFDEPFIFREAEFRDLFPKAVVDRMTQPDSSQPPRYQLRTIAGITLPKGFHFLPKGTELPVVVAARISQSFPLFFSSLPLYALPLRVRDLIDGDRFEGPYAPGEDDLIPHWFSDGGIASNFPIHFFDQWLPKSPTFGITLRYLPDYLDPGHGGADEKRAAKHYLDSMERGKEPERGLGRQIRNRYERSAQASSGQGSLDIVELPRPEDTVPLEWQHILYPGTQEPGWGAAFGFLWAVIKTMQNYRDNLQAGLPSYRERVAQVRLWPNEGGFNLAMERQVIQDVVRKGGSAGGKLAQDFEHKHHQWARLRVLVGELDAKFRKIREDNRFEVFKDLVRQQRPGGSGYPYPGHDDEWCGQVIERMEKLRVAMDEWKKLPANVKLDGAGDPPPALRVTPSV